MSRVVFRRPADLRPIARSLDRLITVLFAATIATGAAAQNAQPPKDCRQIAKSVLSGIRISYLAKEGEIYIQRAKRDFAASPAGCQDGLWFLAAARLLRETGAACPIVAGGTEIRTPREALEMGLAASPSEPDLLAFVAYLSAVSPESSPKLPADACERMSANPEAEEKLRAYVCGHAALSRGDYASAEKELASVEKDPYLPDAALRRAEALLQLDRKAEAKKSLKLALDHLIPGPFLSLSSGATEGEIKALQARAEALSKGKSPGK